MMKRMFALLLCLLTPLAAFADGSAVVAEIGGTQITRAELDAAYEVSYGDYAGDDADLAFDLRHELVSRMLQEAAEKIMQQQMGFDTPTQEEIDAVTVQAEADYAGYVDYYAAMLDDGSMTNDELMEMTEAYLASMDMSLEDYTQQAISALAGEKLRAWALEDLSVSEEEIRAAYDSMVADEKALYAAYPDSFLSCALYGMPYLYVPEGVREVRQIVVSFDADQLAEYGFLSDAIAQGTDVSADLDALYAQLDGRVGEIRNQLHSGKSFADVEMEYSDDWTMLEDGMESAGYFVCADAGIWDPAFTEAAMALETVGQISEPVRMSDGVHILYYASDVPSGPVPFEEARAYVAESAVYQAETDAYAKALDEWMEQLGAQIYLEELD